MDSVGGDDMGLEYTFLTASQLSLAQMKKTVYSLIRTIDDEILVGEDPKIPAFHSDLLSCWVFSNNRGLEMFSEYYKMDLQYDVEFDLFLDEYEKGEEAMLRLIGEIMRIDNSDCVILANGDMPIVMRRNGKTIVDDSRWVERGEFPYEALGVDFDWGVIPYD